MSEISSGKSSLISRLVVFTLIGVAIFCTIYAARMVTVTKPPVKENKVPATVTLIPTPSTEEEMSDEETTFEASSSSFLIQVKDSPTVTVH